MPTGDREHETSRVLDERRLWLSLVEQAAQADLLRRQLEGMRHSLSWRLTAPLRHLRQLFPAPKALNTLSALDHDESTIAFRSQPAPPWIDSARTVVDSRACWFIDVTELAREDLGAGVERVTRRVLGELILAPPKDVNIQPVRLDRRGVYVAANEFLCSFLGLRAEEWRVDEPIRPARGDSFIGLDFCRDHAPLLENALGALKQCGVSIALMVHDVLPISHPAWFPDGVSDAFEAWLRVAAKLADRFICISRCTAQSISDAMVERGMNVSRIDMQIMPLGSDFPSLPAARSLLPARRHGIKRVLTVGTIEPRKGHAQALAAFEGIWQQEAPFEWIVAGRAGWKVDDLLRRIVSHPELGRRLHWIDSPDDRGLVSLYHDCDMLLAPSLGEGYGLPVAEAGRHGLALILRDLPVFREVAGDSATYFSGLGRDVLVQTLLTWHTNATVSNNATHHWITWAEGAAKLKEICALSPRSKPWSEI